MPIRTKSADYQTARESYIAGAQQQHVAECPDAVAVGYVREYGPGYAAGYVVFYGKQSRPAHQYSAPNAEQARLRVEQLLRQAAQVAERRQGHRQLLKTEYHDSVSEDGTPIRRYTTAGTARAVRAALKHAFAGQKFSVTTEGSSLNVRWENGPLRSQVEPLLRRFEAGHFDSSQDMYVWGEGTTLVDAQGQLRVERWGARFVSAYRERDQVQQELEAAELAWLAVEGE